MNCAEEKRSDGRRNCFKTQHIRMANICELPVLTFPQPHSPPSSGLLSAWLPPCATCWTCGWLHVCVPQSVPGNALRCAHATEPVFLSLQPAAASSRAPTCEPTRRQSCCGVGVAGRSWCTCAYFWYVVVSVERAFVIFRFLKFGLFHQFNNDRNHFESSSRKFRHNPQYTPAFRVCVVASVLMPQFCAYGREQLGSDTCTGFAPRPRADFYTPASSPPWLLDS